MSKDKKPYIIGCSLLILLAGSGVYVYLKKNNINFPIEKFITYFGLSSVALALFGYGLYWILNRTPSSSQTEYPKELVPSTKAVEIVKEELAKYNKIGYVTPSWLNGRIQFINEFAIEVRNIKTYTDTSGQTSDRFMSFELVINEGRSTGVAVATVQVDLGEKFLRENWNQRFTWNTTLNRYNLESKRYPMTSSKNYNERLNMRRLALMEEGYTDKEASEMIDPLLKSQIVSQPKQEESKKTPKKAKVKAPRLTDNTDNEEEDDDDDLSSSIDEYRNRGV